MAKRVQFHPPLAPTTDACTVTVFLLFILGWGITDVMCDIMLSDSTYEVEGVRLGEVKKFVDVEFNAHHMEFDLVDPTRVIFSELYALKYTNGVTTTSLAGNGAYGYQEGKGTAAVFTFILGFTQLNETSIIIVDSHNRCLRHLNRIDGQTSTFVGPCSRYGSNNGLRAPFYNPSSVIRDQRFSNKLLVADEYKIFQVDIVTREVVMLFNSTSGLDSLNTIAFSVAGSDLFATTYFGIHKCNLSTKSCQQLAGSVRSETGKQDGKLKDARFYGLAGLVSISENLLLVADTQNGKLRLINEGDDSVSSICRGISSPQYKPAETCSLSYPQSLLVKDNVIYIGASGQILNINFYARARGCRDDISVVLPEGHSTAKFSFRSPSGDKVTVVRPPGKYLYTYNLNNKTECKFIIYVRDSRVRRRVEFQANYQVRCADLMDQWLHSLFIASADFTKEIRDLCNGKCKRVGEVAETCSNDTATLKWSTDLILPAHVTEIPEEFQSEMLPKLKKEHLLKAVIPYQIPPVVFPTKNQDGNFAELIVTEFCMDGFKYNTNTKTCI